MSDSNKTILGGPEPDPNKTILGSAANKTQAMHPPGQDPNRTQAWSPDEPLAFTLTPTREATMANGPAREQFLLEVTAPTQGSNLPGVVEFGQRVPLNLCLVIDRSGSMEGTPLEYAKQACSQIVDLLTSNDVLSIVVFDETVEVLMSPQRVSDKQSIHRGISQLQPGYTTNIYDGLSLGAQQLEVLRESGRVTRMVVLSDGEPTSGIKDFSSLVKHAGEIKDKGITITFLGFGEEYNEELLASMAKKAGGNYYYVANPQALPEIFRVELGKMLSAASTNLRLDIKTARWVSPVSCTGVSGEIDREFTVNLADIEQGATMEIVLDLEFTNHPLGHYRVAQGRFTYETTTGQTKTADVDFIMEFTADPARYSVPVNPRVAAAAEISAAGRLVERTVMGLKTQSISATQALSDLQRTQALLVQDGRVHEAKEVTLAIQAIQSGNLGSAGKTLMGTVVNIDQGKKS